MKRGRVVDAVGNAHEDEHAGNAGERPSGLTAEVSEFGVIFCLGDHGGSGEDHGEADHDEQQRGAEHPLVETYSGCHVFQSSAVR